MTDLPAAINEADERKSFEAWAISEGASVAKAQTGSYRNIYSDILWAAWQARAAQAAPVVPLDVISAAQAFVSNGYRGPLQQAKLVFDYVAALAAAPTAKDTP